MTKLIEDKFHDRYFKCRPLGKTKTYYVVFEGTEVGIFNVWEDAELRTKGVKGSKHKSYKNYKDAEQALKQYLLSNKK